MGCDQLCEACGSDEFCKLLKGLRTSLILEHLITVRQNTSCPVCVLLTHVVERAYDAEQIDDFLTNSSSRCELEWEPANGETYLRRSAMSTFSQLVLRLTGVKKPAIPPFDSEALRTGGSSTHNHRIDVVQTVFYDEGKQDEEDGVRMQANVAGATFRTSLLADWLNRCDELHHHQTSDDVPLKSLIHRGRLRLIDVRTKTVVTMQHPARYFALSYVWGRSMSEYTSANPSEFLSQDKLPQTVRDAINLVADLDEQYLWVDALCIDQFDPADKEAVIPQMDAIYGNAYLTIVAADGDDAEAGLARLGSQKHSLSCLTPPAAEAHGFCVIPAAAPLRYKLHESTWNQRAWTLQEHLLSTRCVFFTNTEVHFVCSVEEMREAYSSGPHSHTENTSVTPERRSARRKTLHDRFLESATDFRKFQPYAELVETYTTRRLTHISDRFDAFRALLHRSTDNKELADNSAEHAESCVPLEIMEKCLRWDQAPDDVETMFRVRRDTRRSRSLPSWSWIAWSGAVFYPYESGKEAEVPNNYRFKVLDAYNIVAVPLTAPLPPRWMARLCDDERRSRDTVTIHLEAPVVRVCLTGPYISDDTVFECYRLHPVSVDGEPLTSVNLMKVRMDPEYVEARGDTHVYEAIGFHHGSRVDVILTDVIDGFAVRVSHWANGLYNTTLWDRYATSKYIRLR